MNTNGIDIRLVPHLWLVLEKGYVNAMEALSRVLQEEVAHQELFAGLHAMTASTLMSFGPIKKKCYPYIITTEMFGDFTGKSYLLLSHEDTNILSRNLRDLNNSIKIEFLKELDNILSAAVITKFSNEYKAKVYGDIPLLFKDVRNLPESILNDFSYSGIAFLSAIRLEVKTEPLFNPIFLWVIDQSTLTKVIAKRPVPPISTLK